MAPRTATVLVLCASFSLAACAPGTRHANFTCEDGRYGSVTWHTDKTALVSFYGDSWTLFEQPSGSGVRYGDGVREVWEHQGTIRVSTGHTEPASCNITDD